MKKLTIKTAKKERIHKDLEDLFSPFLRAGDLTHVYAACGSLASERSFRLEYAHLPDGLNLFDLASLTKALVTAPLYWREFFLKKADPDTSLDSYLSAPSSVFFHSHLKELTLGSLLEHRSGFCAWKNFGLYLRSNSLLSRPREVFLRQDLLRASSDPVYSDLGFLLLGFLLEERLGKNLSEIFYDFLIDAGFDNAFAKRLSFEPFQTSLCIPTGYCPLRLLWLKGQVHDENSWYLGKRTGHAGLFGCLEDLWAYLSWLTASSFFNEIFLKSSRLLENNEKEWVLGWQRGNTESSKVFCLGQSFGHLGFTGSAFWFEPKSKKLGILLTNRVISSRLSSWITLLRKQCFQLFDEYLDELS